MNIERKGEYILTSAQKRMLCEAVIEAAKEVMKYAKNDIEIVVSKGEKEE